MMGNRPRIMTVVIGQRETGKTDYFKELLKHKSVDRALIIDVCNEYTEYPEVTESFMRNTEEKGIYRVPFPMYLSMETRKLLYLDVMMTFRRGFLVCETPNYLFDKKLPNDFVGVLVTGRSRDIDVVVPFSTWGQASHPKLIDNANYVRIYRTADVVERHKEKFQTFMVEIFKKATEIIRSGSKYNCVTIDTDTLEMHKTVEKRNK